MGGGIDTVPLGPGLHMRNPLSTGIQEYPVYMQTLVLTRTPTEGSVYTTTRSTSTASKGQPLSLDVSMSFALAPAKAPVSNHHLPHGREHH